MLKKRFLIIKNVVFNNNNKFRFDDVLNFSCKNSDVSKFSKNTQINRNLNKMLNATKLENIDKNSDENTTNINLNLRILLNEKSFKFQNFRFNSRINYSITSTLTLTLTLTLNTKQFKRLRFRRTRKSINSLSDFVENICVISAINVNTRLKKHKERKKTTRLNINKNYELKQQRFKLEIARFKIEKRRVIKNQQITLLLKQQKLNIEKKKNEFIVFIKQAKDKFRV